jgi:uncharacterized protein YkwD
MILPLCLARFACEKEHQMIVSPKIKPFLYAFLIAASAPAAAFASCVQPPGAAELAKGVLDWINAERKERGLDRFKQSMPLQDAALQHACDMSVNGFFDHIAPGGPDLRTRVKGNGYKMRSAGENIAYSRQLKVSSVADIWRNSPPHWKTILSTDFNDIGIAVTINEAGRVYWVMDVGRAR